MTQDVDIFIEPTEENAKRTITALRSMGYNVIDSIDVQTMLKKKSLTPEIHSEN